MTKDVNRSAYTRKIMEIVANINKQKQEIDRVDICLVHTFVLHKHQIFPSVGGIPLIEEHLLR